MRRISLVLALSLLAPVCVMTEGAPSLENGEFESFASLTSPDFEATVNLTFPVDYFAANATMDVNGLSGLGNASTYPENVTVRLNDTVIWGFQGTGFGPLGKQDQFSTGQELWRHQFGQGGGSRQAYIRLPKYADVQNATLDLEGSGPMQSQQLIDIKGDFSKGIGYLGFSVAGAGDVNRDGCEDVIAGTMWPYAFLYLGGRDMDGDYDLFFPANHPWLGTPASAAGDVDNDGFDDIIAADVFNDKGGLWKGRAYILFGGNAIDNIRDVDLLSPGTDNDNATSVSTAGDVNGDGYDDVIWGTDEAYTTTPGTGHVYLHFGGPSMNSTPDLIFGEGDAGDGFGCVASDAGDVNNDGYDDVIVGAHSNASNGPEAGRAYIFLGGKSMDTIPDVVLSGAAAGDRFGYTVSGAGDLNNDGYDDVIVSAPYNDSAGGDSGVVYAFLGGQNMDNIPDVTLVGGIVGDRFGYSISDAGDMNRDGFDDVIMGTFGNEGHAYLFFGGAPMDNVPDVTYTGGAMGDALGYSVSGAGDVNNDGKDDVMIGAWANKTAGETHGRVYIHTINTPILGAELAIGASPVWKKDGFFNGTTTSGDLSKALNDFIGSAKPSGTDAFGNPYVDVPLGVKAGSEGNITISNLSIVYHYHPTIPDFAYALNGYLKDHRGERDARGNMTVPLKIGAQSEGRVRLSNLTLKRDSAPALTKEIRTAEMDEDTADPTLIDLYDHFHDDVYPDTSLDFSVVSATNSTEVGLGITGKRYLSADTLTGADNDNWTGTVEATVACFDRWGQTTESNQFTIIVRDVNDPPFITSVPAVTAQPGDPYVYDVSAIDGDGDPLHFFLTKAPSGMTIRPLEGTVQWFPAARGTYGVNIVVDDGNATGGQDFTITVLNRPPDITGTPPLNASVGVPYIYDLAAADRNLDVLDYSLIRAPEGMRIQSAAGVLEWTPTSPGDFDVSVQVSDGEALTFQNFTIKVVQPNRPPVILSVSGPDGAKVTPSALLTFAVVANDPDGDILAYSWEDNGERLGSNRTLSRRFASGEHTLLLSVSDGYRSVTRTLKFTVIARPSATGPSPEWAVASNPGVIGGAVVSVMVLGLVIVTGAETGKYQLMLLFMPLYTRLHKEEMLDNETRGMIRGCIISEPGIHYNEIQRRLNLGNGKAAHHLMLLEREGIIRSHVDGRLKRFYPGEMRLDEVPPSLTDLQKVIFRALQKKDGMSQRDLAKALDISFPTVHRHVNRMARMGVLRLERRGLTVRSYIVEGTKTSGNKKEDGSS